MSQLLHVGTRKGLFILKKSSTGWDITDHLFEGEPVTMLLHDPRDSYLYVALSHGHFGPKMHRSADGGKSWEECGLPTYPEVATESEKTDDEKQAPALDEVWALEPSGESTLWAGTIPGGLFRSEDKGTSWHLIESLWNHPDRQRWMGGGKDHAGIHSVCIDPRNALNISVAVSVGGVWESTDGGDSWKCEGQGMRAEYLPPEMAEDPGAQDPHLMVQCPTAPDTFWVQHHNGIFHSTNRGKNWSEITEVDPSVFGFAVAVHPHDPNIAWFVPAIKDETRIPNSGKFSVTKTRDGGKTFEKLTNGLPQENAYDIVYRHALAIDSAGDSLAMGSTTGNFWISENGGENWQSISNHLPPVYCVRFSE